MQPAPVSAPARAHKRLGFAFSPRFLFLAGLGFAWLLPAFWQRSFLYGMLVWDGVLLAAWLVDLYLLPRPASLTLTRAWTSPPALRTPTGVEVTLANQGGVPLDCRLTDDLPAALAPHPPQFSLQVAARASASASYTLTPDARGDYSAGRIFLRYSTPLRLAERWAVAPLDQPVRVYPSFERAGRQTIYLARMRQIELQQRLMRQRGLGREFESLREYQLGDEFRDICWTASARRGKLITKLHQTERSQPVWLMLDCGRLLRARTGELSKLDYAVNAAIGLAQIALYSGDRVGLLAYGRGQQARVSLGRGQRHLRGILDALSNVHAESAEADHLRAAATLQSLQRRRSLIVWITDLAETAAVPDVIEGASQLVGRHLVLFVVVGNPDLVEVAFRPPRAAGEMYESTAAQELVHRRELLLARLRERGALTVEVAPRVLSSRLINQYLVIKERTLL